ncbi:hypothetical protein ACIBUY_04110 [Streptomyces sp. NPDC050085]|uniref:hypothetical protein n=1 Tax=Streptomyces sp. NPDC050085 TaxID=3365600 RepID=UPI0037880DC1
MTPTSGPDRTETRFDRQIEQATGLQVLDLWEFDELGLLTQPASAVAAAHRQLAQAEGVVAWHQRRLHRLTAADRVLTPTLMDRLHHYLTSLHDAITDRDRLAAQVADRLEALKTAEPPTPRSAAELAPRQIAVLLAVARGAMVVEHLVTQRLSIRTRAGQRIRWHDVEDLEQRGLLVRDPSRPPHIGQPLTLTDRGRDALTHRNTPTHRTTPPPPRRPARRSL